MKQRVHIGGDKDKHPKIAGDEEEQRAPVNRAVPCLLVWIMVILLGFPVII